MAGKNGLTYTEIDAAEAIKALGPTVKEATVQVAKSKKVKGDDGKTREAFDVKNVALSAEHVLSAKKWDNGRVSITTIDGQRFSK